MATKEIKIPDIGTTGDVDVIEILVSKGDKINAEDPLITLESEKASMDVPSPESGTVEDIKLKVGDKVSEGAVILTLSTEEASKQTTTTEKAPEPTQSKKAKTETKKITTPDLGTDEEVDIIEVNIKVGDKIEKEAPLITLESEKASMDIPAPFAGEIKEVNVKVGDKIKSGGLIATVLTTGETKTSAPKEKAPEAAPQQKKTPTSSTKLSSSEIVSFASVHAGPAVRKFARELGVNLTKVSGTGRKSRVTKQDVQQYVKAQLSGGAAGGLGVAPLPEIDFSKFGNIEKKPLSKIKKLTAKNLHRNWVMVPHVTQFEEADITEMEAFRQSQKTKAEKQGFKLTPLVFIMKAAVTALKAFPQFTASLEPSGENLIIKNYYNIGVAVDTPDGLVVPVVRNVDKKGLFDIAKELGEISQKARKKMLKPTDMQGSTFTISSLGGIGGTAFTPIVNLPDVAILGVSKSSMKPIYRDGEFIPRLMLPLSLSYDHRVIDGAEGARFTTLLSNCLSDIRSMLL